SRYRVNRLTATFSPVLAPTSSRRLWIVFVSSLTNGWSSKTLSLKNASSFPSTIRGITFSAFPASIACFSKIFRSCSRVEAGTSSRLSQRGAEGLQLTRLLQVLAQPEAGEPPHRHLLAGLGTDLVQQALDRLRVVLDERLVQQDVVKDDRLEFPFDDPGYHVLGLPGVDRLLLEDLP